MFKNLCDTCHLLVYCLNYCWSWRISTGGLKEMHERDNLPCNVSVYILRQWPDESFKYQQNSIGQDILFCDTFSSWTQTYHCSLCAVEFFFLMLNTSFAFDELPEVLCSFCFCLRCFAIALPLSTGSPHNGCNTPLYFGTSLAIVQPSPACLPPSILSSSGFRA